MFFWIHHFYWTVRSNSYWHLAQNSLRNLPGFRQQPFAPPGYQTTKYVSGTPQWGFWTTIIRSIYSSSTIGLWSKCKKRLIEERCYFTLWMWQNQQASNFTIDPALIYLTRVSWGFFLAGRDGSLHPLSSCASLILSDKGAENGSVGSAAQSRAIAFRGGTERSSEKECLQPGSDGEPPSQLSSGFTCVWLDSLQLGFSAVRCRLVFNSRSASDKSYLFTSHSLESLQKHIANHEGTSAFQMPPFWRAICL